MKCTNCGAPLQENALQCSYCGTKVYSLSNFSSLEPRQFAEYLKDHITKHRDKRFDFWIFSFLVLFLILWLGVSYFAYEKLNMLWFGLLFLLSGGFFFLAWGLVIIYYEGKAIDEILSTELTPMVHAYIIQKNISKEDLYLQLKAAEIESSILEIIRRV